MRDIVTFKRGFAEGIEYQKARWINGKITPTLAVIHDTASPLTKGNVATYLRDNTAKVSVHFVIERDGITLQQVPIDRGANHAGRSTYHGRPSCNEFSIGIEMVNPGKMERTAQGGARAWWGQTWTAEECDEFGVEERETPQHGRGLWMPHTEAQIASALSLLHGLFAQVKTLQDIQPHWYISPGRKIDVHPLSPLGYIRSQVLGREEPAEAAADEEALDLDGFARIDVPGDSLNMRRWPSFNPNVIASIPHSAIVPVVKQGTFDGRHWLKVVYAGQEGWIVSRYTDELSSEPTNQET
ncbi:N-acetylmuramoyl-L-alanine amidase [Pseudoroseicyclus sp. H15]